MERFVFLIFSVGFLISMIRCSLLDKYSCVESKNGYVVPDPYQCDRFAVCTHDGNKSLHLCPDGFGMDEITGACDLLPKVDCTERPLLQPPSRDEGSPCIRANGFYPVEGSCSEFYDCREGTEYLHKCAANTVFDDVFASCVHPDQTTRSECNANKIHNFTCPLHENDGSSLLRFGNHDRLPHPTDCSKFFTCLLSGMPRLSSCKPPEVFNPDTGFCTDAKKVKSCENYYEEGKYFSIIVTKIQRGA